MCTSLSINCQCEIENKASCERYKCKTMPQQKCLNASSQPDNNYPLCNNNVSVYPSSDQNEQSNVTSLSDSDCISPLQKCYPGPASDDATATLTCGSEITSDLLAPHSELPSLSPSLAPSLDFPHPQSVAHSATHCPHSSCRASTSDQPEQFQLYSSLDPDYILYNEDEIYSNDFNDNSDNHFYSIEQDLKTFHDKHYSSNESSYYPNIEVNNIEYFVENFEPLNNAVNNVITDPLILSSSSYDQQENEIFESDDDTSSMSSQDTYYSDTSVEDLNDYNKDDESEQDKVDHPSDSHDHEEVEVSKTTLNYKSQLNYDRFHIPKQDPIIDAYEDKRDFLAVARDCLRIIEGKMNKSECAFLSSIAGFDVSSPSYHKFGFAKLKSELIEEAKQYKELNKLSPRDQQRTDDLIDAAKKAKGLLPKNVVRTGYSPSPNKDYVDKKFCDENYDGAGLFDEDDQLINTTESEPLSCHCRSFTHHIKNCPNQGHFCDSVQCLSISNDDFPELNYIFECLCHPVKSLSPFNAPLDETENIHHLHITDPSYIVQLHNPLIPKVPNMQRREKGIMKKVKDCNFQISSTFVKMLERLYLKYFPELPKKDLFPKPTSESICR